jgi:tetratricopeptide (TPR) repeat protein/CHAT domain-containing protein
VSNFIQTRLGMSPSLDIVWRYVFRSGDSLPCGAQRPELDLIGCPALKAFHLGTCGKGRHFHLAQDSGIVIRTFRTIGFVSALIGALLVAVASVSSGQNLNEADALEKSVTELDNAGKYTEAIPLAEHVLAIREKALGPDHPDVATALSNLGGLYLSQGRYADAEPLLQRALAIREKALGRDHPAVAQSLNNLAELYRSQGRYADAEPLDQRALAIWEEALGRDHPDVATSLNNLARLYDDQGRYADAEPLYQRALAIWEKALGRDHPDVATALNNLSGLYWSQGRYADAEPLLQRSLAIWEKALGRDHPDVATALNNLAALYDNQGRYADAEPLLQRALAINEKALGRDHPDVALSLNNLAELYQSQGRYADAEPLFQRALAIWEKALGRDHPDVATALSNLALLYLSQGRHGDAEPLFQRALAIWEKALGRDHPDVARALNNLGGLYRSQGRYVDAEPLYERSLEIREKTLGLDHPYVSSSLNNLALLYDQQGRYADALPIIAQTLSQGTANKTVAFPVLFASQTQNLVSAAQALADSYEVLQRESSSSAGDAISMLAARVAAGSDELAKFVRKDQDLTAESGRLDKIIIAAVSKAPAERNAAAENQIRSRMEIIKLERNKLQNQRFAEYVALSEPQPLALQETQALLTEDEALFIFDFDAKSYAWVITRTNADWTELKISAKALAEQVEQLRQSLTFDVDEPFDAFLAHKIYQETFGSIADKFKGKKRLSVVTNGALTSLPLQLLVSQDPSGKSLKAADWLVRSYAITVLPSVYSLKTLRAQSAISAVKKSMIAFADPVFSKEKHRQVAALRSVTTFYEGGKPDLVSLAKVLLELPETEAEVRAIAEAMNVDKNDLKFGTDASETTVKSTNLDDYRIVYFATHALVAGEVEKFAKVKAEPALALTIPAEPTELDDGLLTASEIAQLKLNADWVVLSACFTAAEDKPGAEALSGLARAFFYAGARSLAVSHWEVDSVATVKLMIEMFQAAARDPKLSHAEALQQSILRFIEGAKSDRWDLRCSE